MKARTTILLTMVAAGAILLWVAISARWSREETTARLDEAKKTQARLTARWREAEQARTTRAAKAAPPIPAAANEAAPTAAKSTPVPAPSPRASWISRTTTRSS